MNRNIKLQSKRSVEEKIYFDYSDLMILLCYRYLGNIQDAEEIMNNGFLQVFKNYKKFVSKHENAFPAWVKKIMINECLMHLRKNKGFNIISIDNIELNLTLSDQDHQFDFEDVLALLIELPVGYRTVFNLYVLEGYKHQEIAEKLNISESTSKTQLHKARQQLQKMITERNLKYGS